MTRAKRPASPPESIGQTLTLERHARRYRCSVDDLKHAVTLAVLSAIATDPVLDDADILDALIAHRPGTPTGDFQSLDHDGHRC